MTLHQCKRHLCSDLAEAGPFCGKCWLDTCNDRFDKCSTDSIAERVRARNLFKRHAPMYVSGFQHDECEWETAREELVNWGDGGQPTKRDYFYGKWYIWNPLVEAMDSNVGVNALLLEWNWNMLQMVHVADKSLRNGRCSTIDLSANPQRSLPDKRETASAVAVLVHELWSV
eukprot:899289-Prymnesium_polylepis.1